ncbi:hypothetical protein [Sandaracinus amylolyticus]|uniref:Uncharacterized protein n=1 Tax=Sandaracinus amylolyticus TaxID=927083 RepID=A0A0F6WA18_9BACT|nr:hypothetical protein [Sandaracinus amylolyticus]AKF11177.1 hypothetical protein DB32_008326 [Sandaracinus amylolyticus]
MKTTVLAATLALFVAITPGLARADGGVSGPQLSSALVLIPIAPGEITFLIADIVYAAERRSMPEGWAFAEIAWATLELAWAGTYAATAATSDHQVPWFDVTYVLGFALAGTFHLVHAIVALSDAIHDQPPNVALTIAPTPGGIRIDGVF